MKTKLGPEDLRDVLAQNRAAALAYADHIGKSSMRDLLQMAETDLLGRIDALKITGTFTETHLRTMLAQVRLVTSQLVDNIGGTLVDAADPMAEMAAQGTLDYMTNADAAYRGVGQQPLALREASVLDSAKMGARSSLLRRIASDEDHPAQMGVLQRYGMNTIGEFEKVLRVGVLTRKSVDEVSDDLTTRSTFLQGKPAFWAERIARTEMMGAYNRAGWESQREVNEQLDGDMVKILSAMFDNRTAADSYAVHGQIRRTDEAFETWYGLMQHPPARPNDREIVVPHRVSWELPKYLRWKTDGEVIARWLWEGRKGDPPPRPNMTTIDIDKFGKEPEKKEDDESREETEPGPGMRDIMAKGALAEGLGDDALIPEHGFAPGEAPYTNAPLDDPDEAEEKQAKIDELLGSMKEDPTRAGRVLHGMPFANNSFWEGWSEAEQDLISTLSDALVESDASTSVDTDDVILKGQSMWKKNVEYGIGDNIDGTSTVPTLIKKDGLYYAYTGANDVIGKHMLSIDKLDAYVVDLDDPKVAEKFPSLKAAPPPKVLTADDIMANKTGAQKGSNEGGFYTGSDGVERYVKVYGDAAQAHCENIANTIYKKLGISAPDSMTFEKDGKTHYAHATVPGDTLDKVHDEVDRKEAGKAILDGFAADVLLGNRDVIGMSKDNILLTDDGVRRIDNGGSLLMRAQAGRKPLSDLHQLKEWDGFFNRSVNTYADVLDAAGVKTHADMKKQLVKGIKDIVKLRDAEGGWSKVVDSIAPTMSDKDRYDVAEMLEARTKLLEEKLKILNKRTPKPKPVKLEAGAWGPTNTTTYEELLKQPKRAAPADTFFHTPNGKTVGAVGQPGTYRDEADRAIRAHATPAQRASITEFTGGSYSEIRNAGRMTEEEFKKSGGYDYATNRRNAENVEAAFDAIPEEKRVPGRVFRGIKVPRAVANTMLAQNDRPHLPGLGAMFSTSREVNPARGFLDNGNGDTHVFMVIEQRRGVAIETISEHKTEQEVLMSGRTRCRLVEHYVADFSAYLKDVLVLHLEEIVEDVPGATPDKPKRTRKKKEPTP